MSGQGSSKEMTRMGHLDHHKIFIRPWREGDDYGVWRILQEASYSHVTSTFKLCLQRNDIRLLGTVVLCVVLGISSSWTWFLVSGLAFLASIYLLSYLSAVVYLYGSTLKDIKNIDQAYFRSPDNHFWVAQYNSEIAGTIAVTQKTSKLKGSPDTDCPESAHVQKVAWLRRMAVGKRYRGLGIAKKLVHKCLSYCKNQHYDSVFLITTEVHHAARSLYSSLGFKLIACKPYKYLNGFITVNTYEYEIQL